MLPFSLVASEISAVDETLLETPEDEINPRTLILKDLILLAEMKEKKLVDLSYLLTWLS